MTGTNQKNSEARAAASRQAPEISFTFAVDKIQIVIPCV
jgi:hypothetical protein